MLGCGIEPQATVMFCGAVIVGRVAGFIVIILETGNNALPQASVAFHVSVTGPPQAPGASVNVELLEFPEIRQPPESPFVKLSVLATRAAPQSSVMSCGAVIAGNKAGLTVIVL